MVSNYEESPSTIWYDAYVCYADSDIDFVKKLSDYLESPQIGYRLFIRDRDLLGGNWVYESFAQLIESQCRRVIIVLSPDFLQCADCKFQSQYAAGLAIEKRSRMLIPIIYRSCPELPSMVRMLSKIDMSGSINSVPKWTLDRLVKSIQDDDQRMLLNNLQRPLITFPSQSILETQSSFNNSSPVVELVNGLDSSASNIRTNTHSFLPTTISTTSSNDEQTKLIPIESTPDTRFSSNNSSKQVKTDTPSKSWIKNIKRKIKVAL